MIQIDIHIPQNCFNCFANTTNVVEDLYCAIKSQKDTSRFDIVSEEACVENYKNSRPEWCPLINVEEKENE